MPTRQADRIKIARALAIKQTTRGATDTLPRWIGAPIPECAPSHSTRAQTIRERCSATTATRSTPQHHRCPSLFAAAPVFVATPQLRRMAQVMQAVDEFEFSDLIAVRFKTRHQKHLIPNSEVLAQDVAVISAQR